MKQIIERFICCLAIILLLTGSFYKATAQKKAPLHQQGDFHIALKLPHVNFLHFTPRKAFTEQQFGFNGYGLGLSYFYKDNRNLVMDASILLTFKLPFPAPLDAWYNKTLSTAYFSITDNYHLKRFSFGYGLNYSMNLFNEYYRHLFADTSTTVFPEGRGLIINKTIGLTLNSYFRLGKTAHVGLIYRPTFVNLSPPAGFNLEHALMLEFCWWFKAAHFIRKQ